MPHSDIASPSRTIEIQKKYSLQAKKSLGQNFIIDSNILQKMVDSAGVDKDTVVIEVGPGIGALTEQVARLAKAVYSFEIDQRLLPVLEDSLAPYKNISIINQDILQVDLGQFCRDQDIDRDRLVVMANLPYYITTPIIMHFLQAPLKLDYLAFMVQKEVGQRIVAGPGTKAYGSLSIAVQYYAQAHILFQVPKTVFRPQPKVDSAVIGLDILDQPSVWVEDEAFFFQVTRASFAQRRKTLWNNLKAHFGKDKEVQAKVQVALGQAGIDPGLRGEALGLADFARLVAALSDQGLKEVGQ